MSAAKTRTPLAWLFLAERALDRWRHRLGGPRGPVRIVPYLGYGDARRVWLRWRVLDGAPLPPDTPGGIFVNLGRMLRRFETDELPFARVTVETGGGRVVIEADDEGYGEATLDGLPPIDGDGLDTRQSVLRLVHPKFEAEANALALVVPDTARFGVISDIDDTVLVTGAYNLWLNLYTSLTNDAEGRVAFPGVAAFYRALIGEPAHNPIFYVSSSPWNLYGLLGRFMRLNGIPEGPMFLRDLGIGPQGLVLKGGHGTHKTKHIEGLLAFYPDLPFILIGDSGQHDAHIYADIVRRHPGRVAAIYLRDVIEGEAHDHEAKELLDQVRADGTPTMFCADLLAAARHAAGAGWIKADDVARVEAEIARAAPVVVDHEKPPQTLTANVSST